MLERLSAIYLRAKVPVNLVYASSVSPDITHMAKVLNYGLTGSHQQGFYLNVL